MQRYAIKLSYKGTNYHGWQIQPNAITVQEELEKAFSTLLKQEIAIVGCGRTDTGVHAVNYWAYMNVENLEGEMNTSSLVNKANGFLPKDIGIQEMKAVANDWHARFDATHRTYEYKVNMEKNPFLESASYFLPKTPNFDTMNEAAKFLLGKQDFECFSKSKTEVNNFLCEISQAEWIKTEDGYSFFITANRFLRNMVRAIVGTLLDIGFTKKGLKDIERIIASKSRSEAGFSVPAHGLYLVEIGYKW